MRIVDSVYMPKPIALKQLPESFFDVLGSGISARLDTTTVALSGDGSLKVIATSLERPEIVLPMAALTVRAHQLWHKEWPAGVLLHSSVQTMIAGVPLVENDRWHYDKSNKVVASSVEPTNFAYGLVPLSGYITHPSRHHVMGQRMKHCRPVERTAVAFTNRQLHKRPVPIESGDRVFTEGFSYKPDLWERLTAYL